MAPYINKYFKNVLGQTLCMQLIPIFFTDFDLASPAIQCWVSRQLLKMIVLLIRQLRSIMHALTVKVRDFCSSVRLNYETKTTYFQNYSLSKTLTYGKFSIDIFTLERDEHIQFLVCQFRLRLRTANLPIAANKHVIYIWQIPSNNSDFGKEGCKKSCN